MTSSNSRFMVHRGAFYVSDVDGMLERRVDTRSWLDCFIQERQNKELVRHKMSSGQTRKCQMVQSHQSTAAIVDTRWRVIALNAAHLCAWSCALCRVFRGLNRQSSCTTSPLSARGRELRPARRGRYKEQRSSGNPSRRGNSRSSQQDGRLLNIAQFALQKYK